MVDQNLSSSCITAANQKARSAQCCWLWLTVHAPSIGRGYHWLYSCGKDAFCSRRVSTGRAIQILSGRAARAYAPVSMLKKKHGCWWHRMYLGASRLAAGRPSVLHRMPSKIRKKHSRTRDSFSTQVSRAQHEPFHPLKKLWDQLLALRWQFEMLWSPKIMAHRPQCRILPNIAPVQMAKRKHQITRVLMNFSWQVLEMALEFSEIQLKQRGTRSGPTMAFFFEKISDDGWLAGTFNFLPTIL